MGERTERVFVRITPITTPSHNSLHRAQHLHNTNRFVTKAQKILTNWHHKRRHYTAGFDLQPAKGTNQLTPNVRRFFEIYGWGRAGKKPLPHAQPKQRQLERDDKLCSAGPAGRRSIVPRRTRCPPASPPRPRTSSALDPHLTASSIVTVVA